MLESLAISIALWAMLCWCIMKYPQKEEDPSERRTQAGVNEDRFPQDEMLRAMGWRIKSRPQKGKDIWVHVTGMEMTTDEAIAAVREHDRSRPKEFM